MSNIVFEERHLFPFRSKFLYKKLWILLFYYPYLFIKSTRFFNAEFNTYLSNFQQTTYSMLGFSLVHWPLIFRSKSNYKLVLALNGSIFYKWSKSSINFKLFSFWANRASFLVTVGPKMEEYLVDQFGILRRSIIRINNFTNAFLSQGQIENKTVSSDALHITYLSLFVEKKGYNEFLGAMKKLVLEGFEGKIQINFLGKFVVTEECGPNHTIENLQNSIQELIAIAEKDAHFKLNINTNGVFGEEKKNVLMNTHIFVLPTYYANEAQPISLIEAAAHGSALISGKTGEVPSMFPANAIVLLDEINSDNIYKAINELLINPSKRKSLALNAYNHSVEEYSQESFNRKWIELLGSNPN